MMTRHGMLAFNGSFVIFYGIRTSLQKPLYFCDFPRGSGSPVPPPPLDPPMLDLHLLLYFVNRRKAKTLMRLRICAVSSEPSLGVHLIRDILL